MFQQPSHSRTPTQQSSIITGKHNALRHPEAEMIPNRRVTACHLQYKVWFNNWPVRNYPLYSHSPLYPKIISSCQPASQLLPTIPESVRSTLSVFFFPCFASRGRLWLSWPFDLLQFLTEALCCPFRTSLVMVSVVWEKPGLTTAGLWAGQRAFII